MISKPLKKVKDLHRNMDFQQPMTSFMHIQVLLPATQMLNYLKMNCNR